MFRNGYQLKIARWLMDLSVSCIEFCKYYHINSPNTCKCQCLDFFFTVQMNLLQNKTYIVRNYNSLGTHVLLNKVDNFSNKSFVIYLKPIRHKLPILRKMWEFEIFHYSIIVEIRNAVEMTNVEPYFIFTRCWLAFSYIKNTIPVYVLKKPTSLWKQQNEIWSSD